MVKSIGNFFIENLKEMEANLSFPENVYHYTSQAAFLKIFSVTNKEEFGFHLSHIRFLNDPKEISFGLEVIKSILSNDSGDSYSDIISIIETLEKNRESDFDNLFIDNLIFIMSFSGNPDLLSQWSLYGDNGYGLSIEIKIQNLINSARKLNVVNNVFPFILPITYYSMQYEKCSCAMYDYDFIIKSFFKYVIENHIANDYDIIRSIIIEYLYFFASFVKHDFYKEEKEWRLFICTGQGNKNIAVKENGKGLKMYYKLPLEELKLIPFRNRDRAIIDHIIIGPCFNNNISILKSVEQQLRLFTGEAGKVIFSKGAIKL